MNQFPAKNLFLLFLTAFIWGTAFVAQSVGMDHIGPFTFNAVRSLVGGIALLPVILIFQRRKTTERRQQEKANRKTLLLGGLSCGLALGLASGLQQVGIQYTTVGKAGFITALYIVIVPILGLFFRKKVGAKLWVSVVIAIFGLYLLCMSGSLRLEWGDFLVLLCAVCFSVHIMVIDYFTTKVDGVQMSCIQFFVAALFSAVCMLFTEGVPDPHAVAISWVPILYAGVLSSGVGYTLQIIGQNGVNPTAARRLGDPGAEHVPQRDSRLRSAVLRHHPGPTPGPQEAPVRVQARGLKTKILFEGKRESRSAGNTERLSFSGLLSGQHFAHNAGEAVHLELVTGEAFGDGRGIFPGDFHPVELAVKVRYFSH